MDYEALEGLLLEKNGAVLEYPFGPDAAVFKVAGKMFALVAWQEEPLRITLKSDPGEADELRRIFSAIQPGYYMNKNHWNTVTLDGSVPQELLLTMVETSYRLVVKGLRKAEREALA
ncbi:MmcQ/YjbR family DNA-binding protein [Trichlorobacter lovleyi]|uniref:MmcQ/YjbR family DNA-binding protein n=1 Tax=Trichlorobacter lovleyi TaxID=313985 RepID=UPI0023F58680|nr:MmcQ/YjbR family DNA-binding protein [Trichlorobacter lovleyi]